MRVAGEDYLVESIKKHPEYSKMSKSNDIGIIRLQSQVGKKKKFDNV